MFKKYQFYSVFIRVCVVLTSVLFLCHIKLILILVILFIVVKSSIFNSNDLTIFFTIAEFDLSTFRVKVFYLFKFENM